MKRKNKKGVAMLFIILGIVMTLIIVYIFLYLPFPSFTKLRMFINYFLILIFWIMLQVGIILGYYKFGAYAIKGLKLLRFKTMAYSMDIRNFILSHT